jgi:hypothetical protein
VLFPVLKAYKCLIALTFHVIKVLKKKSDIPENEGPSAILSVYGPTKNMPQAINQQKQHQLF